MCFSCSLLPTPSTVHNPQRCSGASRNGSLSESGSLKVGHFDTLKTHSPLMCCHGLSQQPANLALKHILYEEGNEGVSVGTQSPSKIRRDHDVPSQL